MKNKAAKQKSKRKGSTSVFGCDLTEHLDNSGQDVPVVLKSCAEFIEKHGIVDGIYRLSGVTSNIQKLRQEFASDQCPDLTRELYLQDIHCVGSLCKLYFRELPNPLLTYELYKKFTEAVSAPDEEEQLIRIQPVIRELPPSHYRTLEYLGNHLNHIASFSDMTNMHIRNLALVWAPNLLRSKEIEVSACNGDAAFLEVRVQQMVVEFILNHMDQLFNNNTEPSTAESEIKGNVGNLEQPASENDDCKALMKSISLAVSAPPPMKLMSLEEAQARSLSASHPARMERRENSLPDALPSDSMLYHTVIELPDSKKLSSKSKKWKSIFNLGKSDSKSKLSRNGSVFVRGPKLSEKAMIRPAKSMDSLCSLPVEEEEKKSSHFKNSASTGGFFIPSLKSNTIGMGGSCEFRKAEARWIQEEVQGAAGGNDPIKEKAIMKTPQPKPLPEQLKVFRGEDLKCEPTSPKTRRMFYPSSDGCTKANFPGSLFPLEASPRHQRKALNISEPFAVSVPLRVSAVINSNSTPCRNPSKEKSSVSSQEEATSRDDLECGASTCSSEDQQDSKTTTSNSSVFTTDKSNEDSSSSPEWELTLESSEGGTASKHNVHNETYKDIDLEAIQLTILSSAEDSSIAPIELHLPGKVEDNTDICKTQMDIIEETVQDATEQGNEVTSSIRVETLWPEIQQELKIVEPEEEVLKDKAIQDISSETESSKSYKQLQANALTSQDLSTSFPTQSESAICVSKDMTINKGKQDTVSENTASISADIKDLDSDVPSLCSDVICNSNLKNVPVVALSERNTTTTDSEDATSSALHDGKQQVSDNSAVAIPSSVDMQSSFPEQPENNLQQTINTDRVVLHHKGQQEHSENMRSGPQSPTTKDSAKLHLRSESTDGALDHIQNSPSRRSQESFDNEEEESLTDGTPGLDLVEPWENSPLWVTSPLHSPSDENIVKAEDCKLPVTEPEPHIESQPTSRQSGDIQEQQRPQSAFPGRFHSHGICNSEVEDLQGKVHNLNSVSDDDDLLRKWMIPPRDQSNEVSNLLHSWSTEHISKESSNVLENPLDLFESFLSASSRSPLELKKIDHCRKAQSHSRTKSSSFTVEPFHDFYKTTKLYMPAQTPINKSASCGQFLTHQSDMPERQEETSCKSKPRPSSLHLDFVSASGICTNFENKIKLCTSGNISSGQKQHGFPNSKFLSSIPPREVEEYQIGQANPSYIENDFGLEFITTPRSATGRRNSAPVSVPAIRTAFMIKTCQAKAVPVIPPKLQYTQVPQPLQVKNSDPQVSLHEKENMLTKADKTSDTKNPPHLGKNQSEQLQLLGLGTDAKEEKENNEPPSVNSRNSRYLGLSASADVSHSKTVSPQDLPVMRRKRTCNGEAATDNPLSSKIERSSGISRSSFRSRSGRPQSLILFSPPFPIMDHPSTVDSNKVLLSPIRSPNETSSLEHIAGGSSENLRTPDGVITRNKMTMPKSGQRLETSTSCFYQPQRRSMVFDSHSGRPIE
ncbi:rho GTPase-activating protein 31 isoform X2 [Protopterus annectens]|uniref:rho GTPase-activating protein 31 isoform X2 n=1 Tax=Protopterus annectens TaxID=7888 RepID=UPI001CFB88FF|nr:rho GTPase-activating protein 31 isoform X2 [Protopterus annectens]